MRRGTFKAPTEPSEVDHACRGGARPRPQQAVEFNAVPYSAWRAGASPAPTVLRDAVRPSWAALCLLVAVVACGAASAQQPAPRKPARKAAPAAAAADADPLAEVRRTAAVNVVNALADEARNFDAPALRARAQARSADVLWDADAERARTLFRRAWEAAEAADAEAERLDEEERRRQTAERGFFAYRPRPSVRNEVLRLAASRERALGEEFLARLEASKKEEESAARQGAGEAAANPGGRRDAMYTPPAVEKRLQLASGLMEEGDVERAIQFADPALTAVTVRAVDFLARLRPRNARAADERFAALLGRAQADPASDANTVSLLSSYLFTPSLYLTFEPGGGTNSSRFGEAMTPPPDLPPQLRAAFFNAAASILLRPIPPAELDQTTAGRAGTYMVIARLLPLFEAHAPARVAALRAKMGALTPDTPEGARSPQNSAYTRGLVPEDPSRDRIQETLARLDRAKTADERDSIYADAATEAVRKKDPRASELVEKIENVDVRRQLRAYLDFEALEAALRARDVKEVLRIAREGEMRPLQRVWGMTEAARLLAKDETGRALEVLDEALVEAKRIDQGTADRVRALVAVATQLHALDRQRAWDMLPEVVRAANAASDFTGEDAFLDVELRTKNSVSRRSTSVEAFDLAGLFGSLARENFDRAVELAGTFKAQHPRASATLASARAVLEKRDAARATR